MSKKRIAALLADGFEEIEALSTVDILRRAGFTCDMVSVTGREVVSSAHGVRVIADTLLENVEQNSYDAVFLPGGQPGSDTLRDNDIVVNWVKAFAADSSKIVAAICAAPQVLAKAGVAAGRRVTSYPDEYFQRIFSDAEYVDDNTQTEEGVVVDGDIITSRGPGTSLPFAFRLVELLGGDADSLREGMEYNALKESL